MSLIGTLSDEYAIAGAVLCNDLIPILPVGSEIDGVCGYEVRR
jgi:hypothetical protein